MDSRDPKILRPREIDGAAGKTLHDTQIQARRVGDEQPSRAIEDADPMGRRPEFRGLGLWQRYSRGGSLESWVGLPNGSIRECSTLLSRDRLALRSSSHEATELKWCPSPCVGTAESFGSG